MAIPHNNMKMVFGVYKCGLSYCNLAKQHYVIALFGYSIHKINLIVVYNII